MYMNTIISMLSFTFWLTNLFVVASCHQGGTKELEKVWFHLLTFVFNEDDIRRYLFDLGIHMEKLRRNQTIIVDVYI